jgi:hypothetical protein
MRLIYKVKNLNQVEVNLTVFAAKRKKLLLKVVFPLFALFLLSRGLFVSDAYAYLDPGSGSVIIQVIIGALVGVGITLKVFWMKLKYKLLGKFAKIKDDE